MSELLVLSTERRRGAMALLNDLLGTIVSGMMDRCFNNTERNHTQGMTKLSVLFFASMMRD